MAWPAPLSNYLRRRRGMPRQGIDVQRPHRVFGSADAQYAVCTEQLDPDAVVYSFGIGQDISFDLELIRDCGVTVHAFDPTPKSIDWVNAQELPANFIMHPWGLASYDGAAVFTPPENPEHVSHTLLERRRFAGEPVEVPVYRLATLMSKLGHDRIDVLKMDIEGAEYEVISSLGKGAGQIRQLLVEFHHQLEGVPLSRTERAIDELGRLGFVCFHESEKGHEFSFIRD